MSSILRQLRKHPSVVPVFIATCAGAAFATAATLRACKVYPDVSFRRSSNPHPWLYVKPDQNVKFIKSADYSKISHPERPKF